MKTKASDFATRAKELLVSGCDQHLFYAALEVRMGVEARLQEYVQANSSTLPTLIKKWKIGHLASGIDDSFERSRDPVQVTISLQGENEPILILRYVPVCQELEEIAQRLGDYLHFRINRIARTTEWWQCFREIVTKGQFLLGIACSGNLLGPPAINLAAMQLSYIAEPGADDHVDFNFLNAVAKVWSAVDVTIWYAIPHVLANNSAKSMPLCSST